MTNKERALAWLVSVDSTVVGARVPSLTALLDAVQAEERVACACVADEQAAVRTADAIRARGNP